MVITLFDKRNYFKRKNCLQAVGVLLILVY